MKKLVLIILALSAIACAKKEETSSTEISNSEISYNLDSVPSQEPNTLTKDSSRQFIRTIELKFRVKDVREANKKIEKTISRWGGFVIYSNLESKVINSSMIPISADSALELTEYEVENNIEFRIPNTKLDTTITSFSDLIDFLDFKTNNAEDVSLKFLSNKLLQKRVNKLDDRLQGDLKKNTKDLYSTTLAEEKLYSKIEERDKALIENLNLKDRVDYSTVTMTVYQKPTISKKNIFYIKDVKELKSPFGYRAIESLQTGWTIITEIMLFFMKIWTILVLVLIGIIIYRNFSFKRS